MASDSGEGQSMEESSSRSDSRKTLFRHARLYGSRKSLFQSRSIAQTTDTESDPWVQKCNKFQVDWQVDTILSSSQKEAHKRRLDKLRQELDYIKTDAWKYKPIEELIGF